MTDTHTPGPWSRNINHHYPIYTQHTREDVRHIASIIHSPTTTEEEKAANYLLITAAPDLLKELQRITSYAEKLERECARLGNKAPLSKHNVTCAKARAAIAKAKGETS